MNFSAKHTCLLQAAVLPATSHVSPSESWAFSGLIPCSSVGFSTGCKKNSSPLVMSEVCKDSACHLTTGQREMASLQCLPTSLLTNLGVCVVSSLPTSLQKRELPKQKALAQQVPPLNYVYCRDTDWSSLRQRWSQLAAGGSFSKLLKQGPHQQPPSLLPKPHQSQTQCIPPLSSVNNILKPTLIYTHINKKPKNSPHQNQNNIATVTPLLPPQVQQPKFPRTFSSRIHILPITSPNSSCPILGAKKDCNGLNPAGNYTLHSHLLTPSLLSAG